MPIVNIKGIGQVRFPDTMSQQAIIGAIENDIIPQHEARIKPAESMRESLVGGAKRGLSSIRTAISAPFDGGQEAGLAGLERQKEIEEKPGASLDYLKYIHETQGPWAAAKELAAQTPRAIAEQVPNLAAMGAGAKAGAMAGARLPLPPQGRAIAGLLGGAAGAFGTSFGPQAGANIERQAQEGKQVDLASAYGTAVPQAGIDVATAALALGKGFGKMLGIDSRLLGTPQAEALAVQKLAQESKKMAFAKGTAKMATLEIPGEVIQQALERYQAGLPLTTPDAMKEYTDTAYQTALMGPVGGASRLAERGSAISKQEEKDFAEAEKAAQEEAAKAKAADEIERAKSYEDQTKADMAGFGAAKNEMAEQDTKAKQVEMLLQTDQGTQHLKDNVAFYLPGKTIKDVVAMKKQMTDQATGVGVQGEMFAGPRGQLPTQEEEVPEVSTEGQGTLFNEKGKPALGAIQVDPLVINEDMLDTWGIPDKNKKLRADLTKYGDLTDPENVAEAKGVLEGYYEKTGKGQEAIAHLDAVDAEHKKLQAQQKQAQEDDQKATDTRSKQLQGQGKPTKEAFQQMAETVRQKIQDFTDREQRQPTQAEIDAMYADHYKEHGIYGQTNLFSEEIEPTSEVTPAKGEEWKNNNDKIMSLWKQGKYNEATTLAKSVMQTEDTNESEGQQATKDQRKLSFNKPRAVKRVEESVLPEATTPEKAVVSNKKAVGVPRGATNVGTTGVVPSTGKKPSALKEAPPAPVTKVHQGAAGNFWDEESDVLYASLEKDTRKRVQEAYVDDNLSAETIDRLTALDKRNKSIAARANAKTEKVANKLAGDIFGAKEEKTKRKYTAKPESQKPGKVTITKPEPQSSQEGDTTKKEEATTTDEINKHINTLFTPQQLKDNPPVVVNTHEELPAHLQEAAKKSNSKALVHEGKSYFIAGATRKGAERGTILHEIGAHLGLEKLIGKDRVAKLANQVTAWAAQVPVGKAKATNEHLIAKEATEKADLSGEKGDRYNQEVIAYFTEIAVNKYKIDPLKGQPKEHGKVAGWLKELWAGIVATLSKLHISPNKLKSADIVDLVYGAARIAGTGVKTEGAANIQSSRATASKENSNGQPIHPTEAGVKNFWKWFGDSKATDKEGRPLLLYTGTSKDTDFSTFKVPRNGAWFTTSASDASSYAVTNDSETHKWDDGKLKAVNRASRVIPVYLRITNPYITSGKDFNAKIFSAAKENYKRGQGIVFDELRQAGHDGILLGGDTWIALDNPNQIKSAIGNTGEYSTSNNAILSSIGESLNSMPSASPKLMEDARDALSTVPTTLRKAALRFYSIPNMIAQYGGILPSLKKLLHTIEQRANDSDHRRSIVDKLTHKGVSLLKKYPKQIVRKFNKVAFELSIANVDPTKDENKDNELVKVYQSLPKPLQDLGNEYAAEYKKHFDEYIHILTEMAPEKMGRDYLTKVEKMRDDFESKGLAWYHPLRRQGDYWLSYTNKDGESVTISRESPRAIEREMKLARIKGATDLKQFARLSQIEYDSKAPPSGLIADILAQMQRDGVKKEVLNNTYQMYLSLLPSQSLRQQMQARTGEQGYIEDVVQGFADVGSKMAHQLSAMKHRPDLDNAYAGIHGEAATDASAEIKDVYEALMAGKSFVENPVASTLSSRLSWLSYFWHIAGNASSAFVNLTQLPVIVLPLLAGKYGLGATTAAFNRAFKMYSNGKFDDNREFMPDFTFGKNPKISQEYKDLYEAALDHSTIRRGVGYELTELRRTSAEDYTGIRSKVETGLGWLFQNSERMNREITLIAAYDLARSKMSPEDARAFAINTTVDAHSHALPEAGPQLFQNNFGKVAFTFKRFAQAQIALMAKMFYNTFKGETKEVRDLALKQMLGIYGTTYAFAGVQGMPLYGAASLLASTVQAMFGDEDEPLDPDEQVKLAVGDMHFKGPVNQLLGVDIASRTGFNGLVWREDARRLAEVGGASYFAEHFFGPSYSTLFINPQRALELFNQGHTDRALETLSPSFIRNPLKAYRFANEGALNRKGAKIVDDVDGLQVFNQILGFTDAELSEAYARAGVMKKVEQHMNTRRQSLLDAFYLANTNGDDEMKDKIRENISSFNKAFPVKPITGETLIQSHKTRVNNLINSVDGVYVPPKLRATLLKYRDHEDDEDYEDLL